MYELNRVRLYSIGPAGARYADTVLDLSDVGDAVPEPAPRQPGFFDEEQTGPVRRPAPAGVLFLENGGGKSVLLKLIFSVMLPGHRNTLGGASSGVLRKFLLADDCGHVALEWQHTVTGESVVVGKVSEWRGRQVSADPRKFAEAWYSFRPGPGLSLESLPVAERAALLPAPGQEDGVPKVTARGRRRTMKGFRDSLTEAGKAYPDLDLTWEEGHDRWIEHLGALGLDPELFRYQREMNADEGEAAGLFAVKNDADFTDLLLRAVTDTRDTDGLADLVHGFAAKLGRRAELTAERDFTGGSLELLQRIAEAATARESVREAHRSAERRTRRLARTLGVRAAAERDRSRELAEQVAAAATVVADAEDGRSRQSLTVAELTHRHATLALAAATGASAALRRELLEARTLHSAWQATETVLRHRAAADRSARVLRRDPRGRTGRRPSARRPHPRRAGAGPRAGGRRRDRRDPRRPGGAAGRGDPGRERGRPPGRHRRDRRRAEGPQRVRAPAPAPGRGRAGDPGRRPGRLDRPGRVRVRTRSTRPAPRSTPSTPRRPPPPPGTRPGASPTRAAVRAREAAARANRAELAAARASDALAAGRTVLAAEQDSAAHLARDPRACDLLGTDADGLTPEQFDHAADPLRELLDSAVASAERTLFDLRTAAADDSRVLAALGDGGLLPPGPDVLATVEYLGEHGVPALPGWRYLAQSVDPADHDRILAARPQLVDGVIVTDPDALLRAREVLTAAALLPRSAVAVGTAAALLGPVTDLPGSGRRHCSWSRRTRPCMTRTPPTRSAASSATGPPPARSRSAPSPPGSAPTGCWPDGWPPGAPAARPDGWRRSRPRPRRPAPPSTWPPPSSPPPAPSRTRPRASRPRRSGCARTGPRPPSSPAAAPTPWPASPTGCASAPTGPATCAPSPTRPPRPSSASNCAPSVPRPPTRTAAQPSAPPTTPAAPSARCAPSAPSCRPPRTPRTRPLRRRPAPRPRCPRCARPTAPPPSSTSRSASAPTCVPSRPAPRATRPPPGSSSTGSPTRSAAAPRSC